MYKLSMLACVLAAAGCGQGPVGPQGTQGLSGLSGASCSVYTLQPSAIAPHGATLIHCPDSTESLILSGSSLSPINFCSTSDQPSVAAFPTVGFCIKSKLYAVIPVASDNLIEVPQGTYDYTTTGLGCTFTVGPNCAVRRQ